MSKIGPHLQRVTAGGLAWSAKARITKVLDDVKGFASAPDDGVRVYRAFLPDQSVTPTSVAFRITSGLGGYRHPRLYVETLNELGKHRRAEYIAFLSAIVPMLHGAGLKVAGPSWATGDYDQEDWDAWRAAGWCGLDAIALHAYWADKGFTPYNALRYRGFWRTGDPPILITECGRDIVRDGDGGTLIGKGGWRADGLSLDQYANEILRYAAELDRDAHVLGATVFTCGPFEMWTNYEADSLAGVLPPSPPSSTDPILPVQPFSPSRPALPSPDPQEAQMATVQGIDVANWQGQIDWGGVRGQGIRFAFCKASEDPAFLDPWFQRNWSECRRVGIVRGAYHFARPSRVSPADSVTHFQTALAAAGGLDTGDLIALDMEDVDVGPSDDLSRWTAEWLDLAERVLGVRPVLYSGHWFMEPHGLEGTGLGKYPLWLASYQEHVPPVPTGWTTLSFWQWSSSETVPGIAGRVDMDLFIGVLDELRALGKPAPVIDTAVIERDVWGPLFTLKDVAWTHGRKQLGDAIFQALREDKERAGAR